MAIVDKLSIMNAALIATGNDPVTVDDGSNAYMVASSAFDRMLPIVMVKHNWPFETAITALVRAGASAFPGYADMYAKPADCLHLQNCWDTLLGQQSLQPLTWEGMTRDGIRAPQFEYRIIGGLIHCNGPNGVTALYVKNPNPDGGDWPPGVAETLTLEVESIILRGLNEDQEAAVVMKKAAAEEIKDARYQVDSELPRKVAFRSRQLERRRARFWR